MRHQLWILAICLFCLGASADDSKPPGLERAVSVSFDELSNKRASLNGRIIEIAGSLELVSRSVNSSHSLLRECGQTPVGERVVLAPNAPGKLKFVSLFLGPQLDFDSDADSEAELFLMRKLKAVEFYCVVLVGVYLDKDLELVHIGQGGTGTIRVLRIGLQR